jgi:LAO/AO transport system kinase
VPDPGSADELLAGASAGDRGALARLLTLVERGDDAGRELSRATFGLAGGAWTVGITGAPGAGKSTLTNRVIAALRARDQRVGVLAVDPSSPFSGGALLGDRVRMGDHALDEGVFIRSMASRGHLGGLASTTPEAARLLDAAGFDWVLVETVGVGQVEVEVAGATDTTVVVLNPGWGDAVQAAKAGLLEVADVFVINKADRPGAQEAQADLEAMLDLSSSHLATDGWRPPIVPVVALTGEGIPALVECLLAHRDALDADQGRPLAARRADRLEAEVEALLVARLRRRVLDAAGPVWAATLDQVRAGRLDPWSATDAVLATLDPALADRAPATGGGDPESS